jgi:hypothetical protein
MAVTLRMHLLGCDDLWLFQQLTYIIIAFIITIEIIRKLRTKLTATSKQAAKKIFNLMMGAIRSSETSVRTTATRYHIPEDDIFPNKENF